MLEGKTAIFLHNLSGQGPGCMIVKLGLAAADGPGSGGTAGTGSPAGTGLAAWAIWLVEQPAY